MSDSMADELLQLNQRLLDSVAEGDWPTYAELCDPTLTAFEPEARGHLIAGMDFHRYYFDAQSDQRPTNTTISSPDVRFMGDVAVVCYVRLIQRTDATGGHETLAFEETRLWQRQDGQWRHVHFHRSANR